MRRQGQYATSGVNAHVTAQARHMPGQRTEHKSSHFQGQLEGLNSEKEHLNGTSTVEGQWKWERVFPKVPIPMLSHVLNRDHKRQNPSRDQKHFHLKTQQFSVDNR